jgi:hypothetical protein
MTYPCSCISARGENGALRCELNLTRNLTQNEKFVCTGLHGMSFDISVIHNNAFKTLRCRSCLHILYLNYNNINVVEPEWFRDLKRLQILYISNNRIEELHQNTFKHNPTLKKLDTSVNRLKFLHTDTFLHTKFFYFLNVLVCNETILNSAYLNILDASYCNAMKHRSWHALGGSNFKGLPNLKNLVLEGNGIRCLTSDTFVHNPQLVELSVRNNALKAIPLDMFSHSYNIHSLKISNNPFVCDCRLKMFSMWCSNHSVALEAACCGTPLGAWTLSQFISCKTGAHVFVSVTDTACTAPAISVIQPTQAANSAASGATLSSSPASEENSPASTTTPAASASLTDVSGTVYLDQQGTISGNSSWYNDTFSSSVRTSISSTTQTAYNHGWD